MADVKPIITNSTPANIKEYPNKYVYIVDVPGLAMSLHGIDIQVAIEDTNVLTIRADHQVNEEDGVVKYIQMQRKIKNINSKFRLPFDANPHGVSACVYNGVLIVTVLKFVPVETNKPQTIKVKADYEGKFS